MSLAKVAVERAKTQQIGITGGLPDALTAIAALLNRATTVVISDLAAPAQSTGSLLPVLMSFPGLSPITVANGDRLSISLQYSFLYSTPAAPVPLEIEIWVDGVPIGSQKTQIVPNVEPINGVMVVQTTPLPAGSHTVEVYYAVTGAGNVAAIDPTHPVSVTVNRIRG